MSRARSANERGWSGVPPNSIVEPTTGAAGGKADVAARFALISNVHCTLWDEGVGEKHVKGAVREVRLVGLLPSQVACIVMVIKLNKEAQSRIKYITHLSAR